MRRLKYWRNYYSEDSENMSKYYSNIKELYFTYKYEMLSLFLKFL